MGVRARMVELARSYAGCGVYSDRERYMALVAGPADTDLENREKLARIPGCALIARGLLRAMGCTHPRLLERWQDGREADDVVTVAKDAGAWIGAELRAGRLPLPGDVVVCRRNQWRHTFAVLRRDGDSLPCEIESLEGGQREHRIFQRAGLAVRTWSEDSGGILDTNGRMRRTVAGWLDIERLLAED